MCEALGRAISARPGAVLRIQVCLCKLFLDFPRRICYFERVEGVIGMKMRHVNTLTFRSGVP